MDANIRRLVDQAVAARMRRERSISVLWTIALLVGGAVMQLSVARYPLFVDHTHVSTAGQVATLSPGDRLGRRMQELQDQVTPLAEQTLVDLFETLIDTEPSDLFETSAELAMSIAPAPEIEVESPADEQPPTNTTDDGVLATPTNDCECPPGPQGPPGDPAPAFLSDQFSWDESRQVLTIRAGTVEFAGSIVVRGYIGVENSVFVGGDPSSGETATELAPGALLLYGTEGGEIAGFQVEEGGWTVSNVTVSGELYESADGMTRPRKVSTRLFTAP